MSEIEATTANHQARRERIAMHVLGQMATSCENAQTFGFIVACTLKLTDELIAQLDGVKDVNAEGSKEAIRDLLAECERLTKELAKEREEAAELRRQLAERGVH